MLPFHYFTNSLSKTPNAHLSIPRCSMHFISMQCMQVVERRVLELSGLELESSSAQQLPTEMQEPSYMKQQSSQGCSYMICRRSCTKKCERIHTPIRQAAVTWSCAHAGAVRKCLHVLQATWWLSTTYALRARATSRQSLSMLKGAEALEAA